MEFDHLVHKAAWPAINDMEPFDLDNAAVPAHRQRGIEQSRIERVGYKPTKIINVPNLYDGHEIELRIFGNLTGEPKPAIYSIHGGGYIFSAAEVSDDKNWIMAQDNDCIIVAVEYRKAPEVPFPKPLEDCYSGLFWLYNEGAKIGVDVNNIILTGESAGGGLAAATALMLHDKAEVKIVGQALIYPMSDHRTGGKLDTDPNPTTGVYCWTREYNQFGWTAYQGNYRLDNSDNGYFSPSLRRDLSGIAPIYMATGALDLFLEENMSYCARASKFAVPVELHVYPGAIHGFENFGNSNIARKFMADRKAAFDCFWGRDE
jgi:acetyl esterase